MPEVRIKQDQHEELIECLELLQSIFNITYHNQNWLATWANQNPKQFNQEVRRLINRALNIVGGSDTQIYT